MPESKRQGRWTSEKHLICCATHMNSASWPRPQVLACDLPPFALPAAARARRALRRSLGIVVVPVARPTAVYRTLSRPVRIPSGY